MREDCKRLQDQLAESDSQVELAARQIFSVGAL